MSNDEMIKTQGKDMNLKFLKITICLLFFVLLFIAKTNAQQTLTLWQCIEIAKDRGYSAKMLNNIYKQKKENYRAFRSGYYPQLSLSGSAPGLTRTIRTFPINGNDLFFPQSQLSSYLNLNLTQSIPLTGGEISLSSGVSRIDILETNESMLWRSTPINLSISQPIFRFNPYPWDSKENELNYEMADRQLVEGLEDISIEVTTKFFDLYIKQMQVENALKNVAVNDTLYQLAQGRFQVGTIAENDLLQSELALSNKKIELENAMLDYSRASEDLLKTMGFEGTEEFTFLPPFELPDFEVSAEKALEMALQNRSDRIDFELQKLRAERELKRTERINSFGATINASIGYNQSAGNLPKVYKDLLDQESLNLSFTVPIVQWGKGSAEYEAALANSERVLTSVEKSKYEFDLEVKYQILRFKQLQKQVAVAARADTIAARRFDVAKNRYIIGKIDMNSLFIAQNEKDAAMQSYIYTLQNYWISYFRIRRLSLYDFQANKPLYSGKN